MTNPANPFDKPESTPTISWAITDSFGNKSSVPIGTRQGGIVVKAPEVVQSTGYAANKELAGKPLFWDNMKKGERTASAMSSDGRANKPVQQIVTILNVNGEDKALWTSFYPKSQFDAIQAAIKGIDGKPRAIEPGDQLYVTLVGFERNEDTTKAASKLYAAEFVKGAGAFAPETAAAAAPPPPVAAPAPPVAVAPAPTPVTEPILSNGYTASALRAGGWSEAQIGALSAPAPVPAPPVAPAPPAPVAVAVDPTVVAAVASTVPDPTPSAAPTTEPSEREKRIAAMSPGDRALLNLG